MKVKFYEQVSDELLKYAVIICRYQDQWIYCKHKERDTYEVPGGHREPGEVIEACARRELYEETGATVFELEQMAVYSVTRGEVETFGMLYYAEVKELGELPPLEIEEIFLCDELPERLTYPLIQPHLVRFVREKLEHRK